MKTFHVLIIDTGRRINMAIWFLIYYDKHHVKELQLQQHYKTRKNQIANHIQIPRRMKDGGQSYQESKNDSYHIKFQLLTNLDKQRNHT